MLKVSLSLGKGTELQRASAGGSRGFAPQPGLWPPPPHSPSRLRPRLCPLTGSLKGIQAWAEGIWGQAARNDLGHAPACFLWFLSDIRRGLKNFPQGRGSPECGLSSQAGSQVQGGPQRREGRRRESLGPEETSITHTLCPPITPPIAPPPSPTGSWGGQLLLFAEGRDASAQDRLIHDQALQPPPRGSVGPGVMTGSEEELSAFPL